MIAITMESVAVRMSSPVARVGYPTHDRLYCE